MLYWEAVLFTDERKSDLYEYEKIITVLAGNTLYALAVSLFILPNGLITGGTTGLALVAQYKLGIPIAAFVGVFNVVMFVAGAAVLGKAFAFTTIISTFYYPFILGVFEGLFGSSPHRGYDAGDRFCRTPDRRGNRHGDTCGGIDRRHGYTAADSQ